MHMMRSRWLDFDGISAAAAQAGTNFPALTDYPAPNCAKRGKA